MSRSRQDASTAPGSRVGAGDLLSLVAKDLEPFDVRRGDGCALVTTPDGTSFELLIEVDRRKLMTLQESSVVVGGPVVAGEGRTVIELHHSGQVRRTGLRGKLRGPEDTEAAELRDRLLADDALAQACLPLDFTRFRVVPMEGRWQAQIRLMGGSHVRTRLPPGGSYIRLGRDQVEALIATVVALDRILPRVQRGPASPVRATVEGAAVQREGDPAPRSRTTHLPVRRRKQRPAGSR